MLCVEYRLANVQTLAEEAAHGQHLDNFVALFLSLRDWYNPWSGGEPSMPILTSP